MPKKDQPAGATETPRELRNQERSLRDNIPEHRKWGAIIGGAALAGAIFIATGHQTKDPFTNWALDGAGLAFAGYSFYEARDKRRRADGIARRAEQAEFYIGTSIQIPTLPQPDATPQQPPALEQPHPHPNE